MIELVLSAIAAVAAATAGVLVGLRLVDWDRLPDLDQTDPLAG